MNQSNFQNMGVPRPAQQGNPQPGGMQRNGGASSDIRAHIMRELSSHPTPTGWQQTISAQNRVAFIHQIITQLSLVKPEYNLTRTFHIATSFEKEKFEQSPDRATYEAHCRTQLKRIYDTRQSQAEQQQQQFLNPQQPQMALMQQQMAMQGMNQNQFPQAYAMPQQAHIQNLGNPMQHHPSQNQRPVQSANPMEMQQQMVNAQPVPNMPQRPPQNQNQPQFTQQEQQQIMQLAEHMAQNVTHEQMNNVQRMVMAIPVDQRQQMQSQGMNPAHAVFRQQAIKRFVHERAIQQQRAGQGPHPLDRGGVVSQQGRPSSQISMRQGQPVPPQPTPQPHDPSFDQFLGQQQDALRHQEAGQVVVPASQTAPPQVRGTPHPQPQGQFGARPMQPPNSFQQQPPAVWNAPPGQHQNVSQTSQPQIPPQTPNLANVPGQTPQQQALQGQLGGLDNSRAQRTPQQNPNMPTLNRPLNPPNQAQNAQRQAQSAPQAGTRNVSGGQQAVAVNGQPGVGQQSGPLNLQKFHSMVAQIPEPRRSAFLAEFKQRQERTKLKKAEAAAQAGPQGAPVALMGDQGTKAQAVPKASAIVPQPPTNPVNRVNGQAQAPQQSGLPNGSRGSQQKFPPVPLDENTTRMMDRVEYPRSILTLTGDKTKVPEHIKQWGQLKQWVLQKSNILPPGSIQKVVGLQSIVYQQKVAQSNQQREALNQAPSQGNTRPVQPGVAPAAQMVAPNSSQQPPIQGPTAQISNSSMPSLPPPTIQEITAARAQLPAEMQNTASDENLRVMILNKRRHAILKTMQGQQNLTPQQQQQQRLSILRMQQEANGQQAQGSMQPNQHGQLQAPQRGQSNQPQPGQQWPQSQTAPRIAQPNPQQAKQPQSSRSGPQASVPAPIQKGGKRPSNSDDVIEVPDPKLSQQQAHPPNIKGHQPQPQAQPQPAPSNASSQIAAEKYNSLPPEAKARLQEQRRLHNEAAQRAANAQRLGQNIQGQRPAEAANQKSAPNAGRDERVKELRSEVMKTMLIRQPIPMSPNTRTRMIDRLRSTCGMSQRLENSLPLFLTLSKDEEKTKDLLRSQIAVQQQLKETQSGAADPVDNFTMSLNELELIQSKLHNYFQFLMSSKVPKTGVSAPTAQNPPQQQLSAANLQSLQEEHKKERVASLQKSHANNSNRAPAAPTTSHAPFSFGGQSPQGVPQFYGPTKNELTQEKLVLPVTKKRKGNNVASPSTPAQAPTPAAPSKLSPFGKTESPDAQRTQAVPPTIKCPVAHCETGIAGFSTKADLEKHIANTHDPKEPVIKDPLDAAAYAIESMRIALNLDQNGKPKPLQDPKAEPMQAQAMKTSLSAQGQSSIKQEAATPMSRNPTQTGPSPSNLLKTPQAAANIKTPASDAKSTVKDTKPIASAKSPAAAAPDPWANSHVKPAWFKEVFSEVADLNRGVSNELIIDWLERNPFTPSTSPSSGVPSKDSPHKSDISANDTLNINVQSDDLLAPEWFDDGLPSDMAALDVGDFMDMDWEATFGKPEEEEEVLAKGKRRRERDPLDPSDEWLKMWAPEKWEEAKKKDLGRKR